MIPTVTMSRDMLSFEPGSHYISHLILAAQSYYKTDSIERLINQMV